MGEEIIGGSNGKIHGRRKIKWKDCSRCVTLFSVWKRLLLEMARSLYSRKGVVYGAKMTT